MRYTLRAVIAALIGSIPPAIAGEVGSNPNTAFPEIPGMIAQRESAQTNAQSGGGGWLFRRSGNTLTSGSAN